MKRKRIEPKGGLLRRMQRKLWMAFLIVCILFVALIGRIMYIQYTSGSRYEKQVLSQLDFESTVIPYKRGDIVDRNGTVLASSVDVYSLIMDAYVLTRNQDDVEYTIRQITRVFPDIEEQRIRDELRSNPESRYINLLKGISFDDMTYFTEAMSKADPDTKERIRGVWFEKNYKRTYPYNTLASDLLGFTSEDGYGAIGLENAYNDILSGVNGRMYGYLDEDNTRQVRTVGAENGKTLVSTIDVNIQSILENAIIDYNKKIGGEGGKGSLATAGLVMDPRNGEILAMADYPNFNLSAPRDLSGIYTPEQLESMSSEEKLDIMNNIWQNYTITHTYEPGSVFKPFTVAAGLEAGILNGDEAYYCDGGEHIGDHTVRCVNRNGHGMLNVEQSLMESCNDALMQMSYAIGGDVFAYYQRLFGFGQRTNVDITGEARTDSLVFDRVGLNKTINLATNSFGQNFNCTMVQMSAAFSSLINGGDLYEPHIVKSILDSGGNIYENKEPVIEKVTVSKETSDIMKRFLGSVVSDGTGSVAGVEGYSIGGKTGTAEKLPRDRGNYLVSFMGFAPVAQPEVLVYIIIDEPNVPDQAHSSYAQEIAHNVFEQVLPYLNIPKETAVTE